MSGTQYSAISAQVPESIDVDEGSAMGANESHLEKGHAPEIPSTKTILTHPERSSTEGVTTSGDSYSADIPVVNERPASTGEKSSSSHVENKAAKSRNVPSAVPQYVRGEEHVHIYHSPHPHRSLPVRSNEERQKSLISEHGHSPVFPPRPPHDELTKMVDKPQKITDVTREQEPASMQKQLMPERPYSPPKVEWDASR